MGMSLSILIKSNNIGVLEWIDDNYVISCLFEGMMESFNPLYFQASFRGKTIWALNREHLQYLIGFLSADIRTVQPDHYKIYKTMRSQSDILPAFMKTAKNRDGIVKLLMKLQMKA